MFIRDTFLLDKVQLASVPSDQGLCCQLKESLDHIECMNGEQR